MLKGSRAHRFSKNIRSTSRLGKSKAFACHAESSCFPNLFTKSGTANMTKSPAPDHTASLRAAALMTAGMMFIPLGDSFAKLALLETAYSNFTIAWTRFAIGLAMVLPIAVIAGKCRNLSASFWKAQLLRGSLIAATIACIITAVGQIPLADAFGAFFIGPAIATLLARFVISEPVSRAEWVAVVAGFIGVLFVIKPASILGGTIAPGQLLALTGGCLYGCYLAATRWTSRVGPPLAQLAGQLGVGMVLLAPLAVGDLIEHGLQSPHLLLGSGASSAIGNLLAIIAFGIVRAATLAPLVYSQLIAATLLGWLIFDELPDAATAFGLAIILLAGLSPLIFTRRIANAGTKTASGG